jgi:hypothetical protein
MLKNNNKKEESDQQLLLNKLSKICEEKDRKDAQLTSLRDDLDKAEKLNEKVQADFDLANEQLMKAKMLQGDKISQLKKVGGLLDAKN